jgi:hypothetical protein
LSSNNNNNNNNKDDGEEEIGITIQQRIDPLVDELHNQHNIPISSTDPLLEKAVRDSLKYGLSPVDIWKTLGQERSYKEKQWPYRT